MEDLAEIGPEQSFGKTSGQLYQVSIAVVAV
jgi:hypothetical protein